MVIVNIIGGLANQMLGYAVGRRLAKFHGVDLLLDTSFFGDTENCTPRVYELDRLNIKASVATQEQLSAIKESSLHWGGVLNKFKHYYSRPVFKERSFAYDSNIFRTHKNVYLKGNFASCHYWEGVEEDLETEFSLKAGYSQNSIQWLHRIKSQPCSVSVHFRRGDYAYDPKTNRFHGLIPLKYYQKALKILMEYCTEQAHFFIFSDDPGWVEENFKCEFPMTIVSETDPSLFHEHLFLMSECDHQVIANSGFSFWGAWLNSNPEKKVIAPKKWFSNEEKNSQLSLVPKNWTHLFFD